VNGGSHSPCNFAWYANLTAAAERPGKYSAIFLRIQYNLTNETTSILVCPLLAASWRVSPLQLSNFPHWTRLLVCVCWTKSYLYPFEGIVRTAVRSKCTASNTLWGLGTRRGSIFLLHSHQPEFLLEYLFDDNHEDLKG
jgi:hypothetical protein